MTDDSSVMPEHGGGAIVKAIADRIEQRMGPLFGSPEYLADPVKLARAEKRRRESAETYARIAYEATATTIDALVEAAEKGLNFIANTESELGITLDSGDALRAALTKSGAR